MTPAARLTDTICFLLTPPKADIDASPKGISGNKILEGEDCEAGNVICVTCIDYVSLSAKYRITWDLKLVTSYFDKNCIDCHRSRCHKGTN